MSCSEAVGFTLLRGFEFLKKVQDDDINQCVILMAIRISKLMG